MEGVDDLDKSAKLGGNATPRRSTSSLDAVNSCPHLLATLTLSCALVVAAVAASGNSDFLSALGRARPNVRWDVSTLIEASLSGDGRQYIAVVGYGNGGIVLAIGTRADSKPIQYLPFAVGQSQAGVCATPVKLSVVPLSCESDSTALPGCVASTHAEGLTIDDSHCDPINLYWDKDHGRLAWWRN
jgi:hypothetical protein